MVHGHSSLITASGANLKRALFALTGRNSLTDHPLERSSRRAIGARVSATDAAPTELVEAASSYFYDASTHNPAANQILGFAAACRTITFATRSTPTPATPVRQPGVGAHLG